MAEKTILLSVDQSNYNYRAAVGPMRKRLFPVVTRVQPVLFLSAILLYIVIVAADVNAKFGPSVANSLALLSLGGLVAYVILSFYRVRKSWAAIANAPCRSGIQKMALDSEKMSLSHPGVKSEIYWSHVVDVIDGRDGLLVLIGKLEGYPIPASAIPKGMTQVELKKQIADWIAQSRK